VPPGVHRSWLVSARVGERLVDLGDDRGSFAHCGRHALRGSRSDVADRENSGPTCLKLEGRSPNVEVRSELFAGAHEPSFIDIDAAAQPSSVGIGADKKKDLAQPRFEVRSAVPAPERRAEHAARLPL
jgi:hypothetical protein